MSWNSSTMTRAKRSAYEARSDASSRNRSRAWSWRSSKSSPALAVFASAKAVAYAVSRSPSRAATPAARSSRSAVASRSTASRYAVQPGPQSASILYVGKVRPASTASCAVATRAPGLAAASSACAAGIARRDRLARLGDRRDRRDRRQGRDRRAGAAQRVVDLADRLLQAVDPVGGRDVDRRVAAVVDPGRVGAPPRRRAQLARDGVVEHHERGIQAGGHGVAAQDPRAEAVDRPDPGALGLPRRLALAERQEAGPHARAQLAGRLLGEGDGQDLPGAQAVVQHRPHEALHEHRRLAAAGARREQQRALAPRDRTSLLLGERPHASLRQIIGYEQPPP